MRVRDAIAVAIVALASSGGLAQQQGTGRAGRWESRIPAKPDPSKIVVPKGYKAEVFVAGFDTPSSAAVDGNGSVAISGPLFMTGTEPAHIKVFDPNGQLLEEIGRGTFKTVMNEIACCAENRKIHIPEYGEKIWEIDGVNGELKLIVKDLMIGNHRNGGMT